VEQAIRVTWRDGGREPQCEPNPNYPEGIDLDASDGAARTCVAKLPYPAKRCGHFLVKCRACGSRVACTTAGRPDDPRSIKIACADQTAAVN
jgi:hypothetical protein